MLKKLKKYLIPALKKPAPICAMILDSRIKTTHFEINWLFLSDELKVHMIPDAYVSVFQTKALHYDNKIEQSIFAPKLATRTLASEIQQYLTETTEDQSVNILKYWHSREKSFPLAGRDGQVFPGHSSNISCQRTSILEIKGHHWPSKGHP
ncbi:uncharacterized protein VP01_461g3 [Puccinia sorghi]|uniref:Uncharacterized protein n=1 Tax=Puccinia sorghi TaxID=27349 RepID=A0A0L6UNF4_9BASI|nr:uncharacterized protein VP01_461g3 [Puccinia sorghi]